MAPRKDTHQHNSSLDASALEAVAAAAEEENAVVNSLNLNVLYRHDTEVVHIVYRAHYAVVYVFASESQQWEKSGIEGSMFICQLAGNDKSIARYKVMCLNRRGLENFNFELGDGDEVEFTDELIIFQKDDAQGEPQVYGIWIFSEPEPSSTADQPKEFAQKLKEAIDTAEKARQLQQVEGLRRHNEEQYARHEDGGAYGQQKSPIQGLAQQRQQDGNWAAVNYNIPRSSAHSPQNYPDFSNPLFVQSPNIAFAMAGVHSGVPHNPSQSFPAQQHPSYSQAPFQQQPFPQQFLQQSRSQPATAALGGQQQHLLGLFQNARANPQSPF